MTDLSPTADRPFTDRRFRTEDLPDTPTRRFRIPASGWTDCPDELSALEEEVGEPAEYTRRIDQFLLWSVGPPVGTSVYMAIDSRHLDRRFRFDLKGRTGTGWGPDGTEHVRFREWKKSLLAEKDDL